VAAGAFVEGAVFEGGQVAVDRGLGGGDLGVDGLPLGLVLAAVGDTELPLPCMLDVSDHLVMQQQKLDSHLSRPPSITGSFRVTSQTVGLRNPTGTDWRAPWHPIPLVTPTTLVGIVHHGYGYDRAESWHRLVFGIPF